MPYRPPLERRQDVARARQLRQQKMTIEQIAREMGRARSTVSDYLNHPESGELYRGRERQYQDCPTCEGEMSYGSRQCKDCSINRPYYYPLGT